MPSELRREALGLIVIIKVSCQRCDAETRLSLVDLNYNGLFRCWKCKQPYMFVIENDKIKYFKPLSDEKYGKQLELDL